MADVRPLRALHYDPAVVGSLADVVAPPYDVIDASERALLLARSRLNVVAVDLPQPFDAATRDAPADTDPYAAAGELWASWQREGVLVRDEAPALWAHTQQYTGPDGVRRTRRGFFCRVRIEDYGAGRVRPHERTHPGPKEDRLRLTRATRANLSPIFSLYSDPQQAAWRALEPHTSGAPWAEIEDGDGTVHSVWRVADAQAIAAVQAATRTAELLIADGHHRYETMQAYAREVDAAGASGGAARGAAAADDHHYMLMCLVALEDPGLTVFATHRLIGGLDEERRAALARALERDFEMTEVRLEEIAPPPGEGVLELGYFDGRDERARRLTLREQAIADAALPGHSDAYRRLDTGVLETLVLKNALDMSDEDIAHFNGLFYARDTAEALELVRSGEYDAAFVMRATPVDQVRAVAAAGENMPPKSTYFFPKLLTGLLFNPLEPTGTGI
jgi:uncharacterized protein (DUF1015 family)